MPASTDHLTLAQLDVLDAFREAHPGAEYYPLEDLHCVRWPCGEEIRRLTFEDLMASAWAAERPPPSRKYSMTTPSPPPPAWEWLPCVDDLAEGGL